MPALLNLQKHKILNVVNAQLIDPNIFTVSSDDESFSLRYQDLSFTFYLLKDSYSDCYISYTIFSPTFQTADVSDVSFDDALGIFGEWLDADLRPYFAEQSLEDPWETIANAFDLNNSANSDERFTKAEIRQLETGLDDFTAYANDTLQLENSKLDVILKEIRDLKAELKTETKRKWFRNLKGFLWQEILQAIKDDGTRKLAMKYFTNLYETVKENLPRFLE